jgi:D-alanyl-lipoteichoic acid acyltransferase DltB (MBOAT superfamily)
LNYVFEGLGRTREWKNAPMLFNSLFYILFLILATGAFYLAPLSKRWALLTLAGMFSYATWNVEHLCILFSCILLNFYAALRIDALTDPDARLFYLRVTIILNLAMLFVFKYLDFGLATFRELTGALGYPISPVVLGLALPIGISFYTFQALGYVIDVYWGVQKPERNPGRFTLFLSFFPQTASGPIERAGDLLPQFSELDKAPRDGDIEIGVSRLLWGLFKKAVVADNIALYTNVLFGNISNHQGLTLYLGVVLFSFQLYCDFSGYTDMAIGSARLFGVRLSENFRLPFSSASIQEFWSRWHITLYNWFRSYVYMPIAYGYRHHGRLASPAAILLTFTVSGLWHGASWNFVTFGLVHGLAVLLEAFLFPKLKINLERPLGRCLGWVYTFHVWLFSLVWFRTDTLADALIYLRRLQVWDWNFDIIDAGVMARVATGLLLLIGFELSYLRRRTFDDLWNKYGMPGACVLGGSCLLAILLFGIAGGQFIYFRF